MTNAETLQHLAEAGALAPLDRHFALTLATLGGEDMALLAAVLSAAQRRGHVCLPLQDCAGRRLLDVLAWQPERDRADSAAPLPATVAEARLPPLATLAKAVTASPVVATAEQAASTEPPTPLVFDGGRLYLRRVFDTERALAERLTAAATPADANRDALTLVDQRLAKDAPARRAARLAVSARLAIVTGGPGTGKTTLAGKLLALLLESGLAEPHRIALATPTGKAATRLQQAVADQLAAAAQDVPALATCQPQATTIHRLLQQAGGGLLPLDVLLLDECSMLDLRLMARLLAALPTETRLILLGDAAQLASVQPGAVFSDLCADAPDSALAEWVVRLTTSHRFRADSGIGRLAAAVANGDATGALAALAADDDTTLEPLAGQPDFGRLATETAQQGVLPLLQRWQNAPPLPKEAPAMENLPPPFLPRRILLAHRTGPFGVERFNRLVTRHLRTAGVVPEADEFYPGRPLIVTRNDPATGLANGDTGVALAAEAGGRQVWFPDRAGPDGAPFLVAPGRLPAHESFFAVTVHRAQGSEYDEVAFVPGPAESPANSRELFYTAVTRARRKVVVHATEGTVTASVAKKTQRSSGLAERLRQRRP